MLDIFLYEFYDSQKADRPLISKLPSLYAYKKEKPRVISLSS